MKGIWEFLTGGLLGLFGLNPLTSGGGASTVASEVASMLQAPVQGASAYSSGWQPYAANANVSFGGDVMLYDAINDLSSQAVQGGLVGAVENLALGIVEQGIAQLLAGS